MSDWNSKMNPPPKKNKEENSGDRSLVLGLLVVKYLLSLMFLFVKWKILIEYGENYKLGYYTPPP